MGAVIVLITLLVGLLSGLTAGLGRQNVSAITGLPADKIAFQAPGDGQDVSYSNSTVSEKQWQVWAGAPGVAVPNRWASPPPGPPPGTGAPGSPPSASGPAPASPPAATGSTAARRCCPPGPPTTSACGPVTPSPWPGSN
nr:hypothetical protein [Micromonospora provocatoris]